MKKMAIKLIPFTKYFMFIWLALKGCGDLYFYDFGYYFDRVYFLVAYCVFCVAFQLEMNKNKEIKRTVSGTAAVSCITLEAFFVMLFAQEHLILTCGIIVLLLLVYAYLYNHILAENITPEEKLRITEKKSRIRAQRLMCSIAAVVLIIPSAIGFVNEYMSPSFSGVEWETFVDEFNENKKDAEENHFEMHKDTLLKIDDWDKLDKDERTELIYELGVIELECLGLDENVGVTITADKAEKYTLGYYKDSKKCIVINIDHICSDSIEENLVTIFHEVYHAYQYHVVDTVNFGNKFVKTSYYYEDAREWKENIENYISAEEDFEGYQTQPLEADAEEYAQNRMAEYMYVVSKMEEK